MLVTPGREEPDTARVSLATIDDQRPQSREDEAMIAAIRHHFADPHAFEACAAAIWAMYAPSSDYTLTAPSRDGGGTPALDLRAG